MSPNTIEPSDSVSCLHTIEHFGLGRYSDEIDVNGHVRGINNLISIVEPGGKLYLSFPIGICDEVHFNAHRVFHPKTILDLQSIKENMHLDRFDFVDDDGELHCNVTIEDAIDKTTFGCGIYTFRKLAKDRHIRVKV